jgi:flagellar biosynthesis component FlhA
MINFYFKSIFQKKGKNNNNIKNIIYIEIIFLIMKVTDAVKKVVDENILYQIVLSSGLANLNALSRQIKNVVDSLTNEDVKLNTIEKALTKLINKNVAIENISTRGTNVSLESGVTEI